MTPPGILRVAYLAGSGHTGSTMMALLMDSHPTVVSVGETAFKPSSRRAGHFAMKCSCGAPYGECPFWTDVFARVRLDGYDFGPRTWTNDYRYQSQLAHQALTRYSGRPLVRWFQRRSLRWLPGHAQRATRIDRVNVSFIRAVLEVSRKQVFFDTSKRPVRLERMLGIPEIELRLISLVRDVRGLAASAKRRGMDIVSEARGWKYQQEIVAEIARALPADRVTRLRYEDLCADPSGELTRLHRFIGVPPVPPPDVVVTHEHHVLGNRIRRQETLRVRPSADWGGALTPQELDRVLLVAGDMNARLGYQ